MKNKLMEIFDERYDEIFNKIILKVTDRENSKKLLGKIFSDTWDTLTEKNTTKESIRLVFSQTMLVHGIS